MRDLHTGLDSEPEAENFDHFARFYDQDYRNYREDIPLILELAAAAGGPVLELGCGTGRLLAPLAAAGLQSTGVDISPALLALAQSKLRAQKLEERVSLVKADLGRFALEARYQFAFCTSNTLMHLASQSRQLQTLENVYAHLLPGARLLIDLFNPDVVDLVDVDGVRELADEWTDPHSGRQVLKWSIRSVDWASQLQQTTFIYEEIGADGTSAETVCPFLLRFLWQSEAKLLLERAGFQIDAIWGDFDRSVYQAHSPRLILIAQR